MSVKRLLLRAAEAPAFAAMTNVWIIQIGSSLFGEESKPSIYIKVWKQELWFASISEQAPVNQLKT
jgi:hypothetical protein